MPRTPTLRPLCATCREDGGPTACMAHPQVLGNIRKLVREARVLSTADARLAQSMGLLSIPSVGRSGWNDGVIYPPTQPQGHPQEAARSSRPSERVSLSRASGRLNCLVLLVDFADNPGTTPPAHFEKLLFDTTNAGSMASFYKEMSYGALQISGQVVGWLRASKPYAHYTDGQSGTGNGFPRNTPSTASSSFTPAVAPRASAIPPSART
jgi:immune inhibitor A